MLDLHEESQKEACLSIAQRNPELEIVSAPRVVETVKNVSSADGNKGKHPGKGPGEGEE